MLKELIKLANHLDSKGLLKEADYLDAIIKSAQHEYSRELRRMAIEVGRRTRMSDGRLAVQAGRAGVPVLYAALVESGMAAGVATAFTTAMIGLSVFVITTLLVDAGLQAVGINPEGITIPGDMGNIDWSPEAIVETLEHGAGEAKEKVEEAAEAAAETAGELAAGVKHFAPKWLGGEGADLF